MTLGSLRQWSLYDIEIFDNAVDLNGWSGEGAYLHNCSNRQVLRSKNCDPNPITKTF